MNPCRETAKMGVPRAAQALAPRARQPSRGTAGLAPRRTSEWYVAGADTRGRQEGRPYLWSQQVIHGISGLGAERKLDQRHVIKRATPSNSSIFLDSYFDMIYLILNILYRGS